MRRSFHLIAVTALAFSTVATDALAQKRGGTLRVAMNRTFNGFDTATNPTVFPTKLNVQRAIYEDLFGLDKDGKIIPKLGTSLKISPDQKTFTVTLRRGVKFSNGEPFTAQAYSDHFKRAMKATMVNFIKGQIGPLQDVVAIDDYTVEFRMSRSHTGFKAALTGPFQFFWVNAPEHAKNMRAFVSKLPVGTGPYMLDSWDQGVSLTLVRNPNYRHPEKQYLDKIVMPLISREEARLNGLKAGNLDLYITNSGKIAKLAEKDPNIEVFGQVDQGSGIVALDTSKPPLNDIRVRKALAHAVDRKVEVQAALGGVGGILATDWFGPKSKWYCGGKTSYPEYDPAKAKALLKDYGKPVKFKLAVLTFPVFLTGAQVYQSFWKRVGIQVEIDPRPPGASWVLPLLRGGFQSFFLGIGGAVDPGFQAQNLHSKSGGNFFKFSHPEVDKALEATYPPFKNQAKRQAAFCNYVTTVIKHQPFLLRYHNTFYSISKKYVKGPKMPVYKMSHLHEMWLDN
ncbi:MAG: ABC transporter substrate-binding protein [Rhodospirillales bacterium]|jgi:ABC-type transport system substrate-binding protein